MSVHKRNLTLETINSYTIVRVKVQKLTIHKLLQFSSVLLVQIANGKSIKQDLQQHLSIE